MKDIPKKRLQPKGVDRALRVFSVYFWHSEGWTPRNEAILEAAPKRARTTKHPWLIACGANMSPKDFEKSLWFQKDRMHVIAPEECQLADQKMPKENGLRRCMTVSLLATA